MGRLSLYTRELADAICDRLKEGESLRAICAPQEMPAAGTVRGWVVDDIDGFAERYARAKDIGVEALVDDALHEAESVRAAAFKTVKPDGTEVRHVDAVDRSRLKVDTIKWYASKIARKKFGDKIDVEHSGTVDVAHRIVESRKRSGG